MSETMTLEELTALTLRRHFLIDPRPEKDLGRVISRICGLNAQSARGPYLSLWSRVEGFTRAALTAALYEEKSLIKAWLMRGTVHIVTTADFPLYQKALGDSLFEAWEASLEKQTLVDLPRTWTKLLDATVNSLAEGPLAKSDLVARVKGLLKGYSEAQQKRLVGWALRLLTYRGQVCHARPTGPWYHFKDNRFGLVSAWLPPERLEAVDGGEARGDLIVRYLGGYGPATLQDFAYWSGLKMPLAREALEAARERLSEITVEGSRATHWIPTEDLDSMRVPGPETSLSLLPEFDPLIMGHKNKSRHMTEDDRKHVFKRLGVVTPTLLLGGRVAGTWDYRFTGRSLEIRPFESLTPDLRRAVEAASERLQTFLEV